MIDVKFILSMLIQTIKTENKLSAVEIDKFPGLPAHVPGP